MKIIKTADLQPDDLSRSEALYIYNGLDCAVTYEILEHLLPQLSPVTAATYGLSRSLQGPVLEMNNRGLLVDQERKAETIKDFKIEIYRLTEQVNRMVREGLGFDFPIAKTREYDYPSPDQLRHLFYDHMGIAAKTQSVDRNALEQLEHYFYAEPIVGHILRLRDLAKKVSFLNTAIDPMGDYELASILQALEQEDLLLRFQISGQEPIYRTSRIDSAPSSSPTLDTSSETSTSSRPTAGEWELSTGTFLGIAAISMLVSLVISTLLWLSADSPNLTGQADLKSNRSIANGKFYREFSYRDASKKLGHATNYRGKPEEISRQTHIPISNIVGFQVPYLKQFPAFELWWEWVERQVRDVRRITTLLGRQRYFLGDWKDPETIRQATAYEPQSITADSINRGILRLWGANACQLLVQVHDSILFQFPEHLEAEFIPQAIALVEETHRLKDGRDFKIPAEAKVGWNWSDNKDDPDALRKFSDSSRPSVRTRQPPRR
jgi:DNA polymerase I-like protein with 3'-5' exonuclease and polymerase domains